ncbi:hypothetical protein BKA81DRAFT_365888 [Phyllosticta paracitricarpa]
MWRGLERVRRRVDPVVLLTGMDCLLDAALLLLSLLLEPRYAAAGTGSASVERFPPLPGRSEGGRCDVFAAMVALDMVGGVGGAAAVVLTEQDDDEGDE